MTVRLNTYEPGLGGIIQSVLWAKTISNAVTKHELCDYLWLIIVKPNDWYAVSIYGPYDLSGSVSRHRRKSAGIGPEGEYFLLKKPKRLMIIQRFNSTM